MLRPLTEKELERLYHEDVYRDFPESEIKPWSVVSDLYGRGLYEPLGYFDGDKLTAYALQIVPRSGAPLLDYLAVIPEYRGSGVGSAVLSRLRERYHDRGGIMIECEHPDEAPDRDAALRRLAFYDRAGAVLTDTQVRLFGVLFLIYRLPCSDGSTAAPADAMESIYRLSVPAHQYDGAVSIFPGAYRR